MNIILVGIRERAQGHLRSVNAMPKWCQPVCSSHCESKRSPSFFLFVRPIAKLNPRIFARSRIHIRTLIISLSLQLLKVLAAEQSSQLFLAEEEEECGSTESLKRSLPRLGS